MRANACSGDLVARDRQRLLSAAEQAQLEAHLAGCAPCRLAGQLGADFDAVGELRPGDDLRIARMASQIRRRQRREAHLQRRARRPVGRTWPVLVAAGVALMATGGASAGLWLSRRARLQDSAVAAVAAARATRAPRSQPVAPAPPAVVAEESRPPVDRPPEAVGGPAPRPHARARTVAAAPVADGGALFAEANEARRRGDVARAVTLYQQLQQTAPRSPEARLSHVSLGRLLLARGDAAAALAQLDAYLTAEAGGALAAEALNGRARALGALGRAADERASWQRLLGQFPDSVYAAPARRRLAQLP